METGRRIGADLVVSGELASGASRNGITTLTYGAFPRSYAFP